MLIELAVNLIQTAKYMIALTGAGFSTPSGIPDFRSSDDGLWHKYNPMEVASLTVFRLKPERFFDWFRPLAKQILSAKPNPAHLALAKLEDSGYLKSVITQNIDGLHQKAGTQNLFEVHGTLNTLTCISCYTQFQTPEFSIPYIESGVIPRCIKCNGILKPDAILFEEQLPKETWLRVENEIKKCDLLIVAGSSLEVLPVANLSFRAVNQGAELIIINQQATYIDSRASVVFHKDVAEILPVIVEQLTDVKAI